MSTKSKSDDGKHRKKRAPVNIAFSSSRNAALIERKMLHYTTLSIKLHYCTLSEIKTQVFYIVRRSCLCLNTLRGSETTLKLGLFNKIYRLYVANMC